MQGKERLLSGGSFKKFIFNQIMRWSSEKSRKIWSRQTGCIEISSFKVVPDSSAYVQKVTIFWYAIEMPYFFPGNTLHAIG